MCPGGIYRSLRQIMSPFPVPRKVLPLPRRHRSFPASDTEPLDSLCPLLSIFFRYQDHYPRLFGSKVQAHSSNLSSIDNTVFKIRTTTFSFVQISHSLSECSDFSVRDKKKIESFKSKISSLGRQCPNLGHSKARTRKSGRC